jgi:hypothetical protein
MGEMQTRTFGGKPINMGEMCVMDESGDTKIIWDSKNADEVDNAREQFNRLLKKGFIAYTVAKNGKQGEIIREFDPEAEKIILSPPMAGG